MGSELVKRFCVRFVCLFCAVLAGMPGFAETQAPSFYASSYALVIGNDNYTQGWPKLEGAVNDAKLVADALSKQGYDVETLYDANSETLQNAFRQFFIVKGKEKDSRLLLWYAGHGQTMNNEGFIVPTDSPAKEDESFKLSAIHMRDFGSWVRLAEAKHVLAIFDSCFSGTVFFQERGAPPAISRAISHPVRSFITSGDADQPVLDNGMFRDLFIKAINGDENSDLNGDGYLTASELGYFISDRVTNVTNALQTPRYGKLMDRNYNQGEFVLAVLGRDGREDSTVVGLQSNDDEALVWQSASDINSLESYQAYLKRFPQGSFSDLAYIQIMNLKSTNANQSAKGPVTDSARSESKVVMPNQEVKPPAQQQMDEMQRRLNEQVVAAPFSVEETGKVDAYIKDAMEKDIKPRDVAPSYWRKGDSCSTIRDRSWRDYRDCVYYQRYYGRLW